LPLELRLELRDARRLLLDSGAELVDPRAESRVLGLEVGYPAGRRVGRFGQLALPRSERVELLVSSLKLAPELRDARLVLADRSVEVVDLRAPEVDFLLRELVRARLRDVELGLELFGLYAFLREHLFETGGVGLEAIAFGLRGLEAPLQLEEGAFRAAFRRLDSLSELLFELRGTLLRFAQRLLQQGESLFGEFPRIGHVVIRRLGASSCCSVQALPATGTVFSHVLT